MTRTYFLGFASLLLACHPGGDPSSEPPPVTCDSPAGAGGVHDSCSAMDARAVPDPEAGACDCSLGYAWDGHQCVHLADCYCKGSDCDRLFSDLDACESAHAECTDEPPVSTGEPQRLSCEDEARFREEADGPADEMSCVAMDARAVPDPEAGACDCSLGYAWNGNACVHLADCFCEGDDCVGLFRDRDACEEAYVSCISEAPPPSEKPLRLSCEDEERYVEEADGPADEIACAAMDATDVPDPEAGACDCSLGYAWNGNACVHLADCFCEGDDCGQLFRDRKACEKAYASCSSEPAPQLSCEDEGRFAHLHYGCLPMDVRGFTDPEMGSCDCSLGYAWAGSECVPLTGCLCEGTDCDKLFRDLDECTAAHPSSCPGQPDA
ncbi:MAG: hypothetical protein JW940_22080 [Polyangiaceae bacterium]|nr:hypothetical protein [Polyangiaceae bacterium]